MPTGQMLPTVPHPRTRPGGEAYTENDKEFHLLERDGGIRQYVKLEYPAMRYRGMSDPDTGKAVCEQRIVGSEREDDDARPAGWCASPVEALAAFEQGARDVAESAARAAHQAQRMTEPAKREYFKKSRESEDHVTE